MSDPRARDAKAPEPTAEAGAEEAEATAFLREVEEKEEAAEADRFLRQLDTVQRFYEMPPPSSRAPRSLDPERIEAERRAADPENQARLRRLRRVFWAIFALAFALAVGGAVVLSRGG